MSVAQRSDKGELEEGMDAHVSRKRERELEHKLEGAKTAKQIKELEHQVEMLRAAWKIKEIEYDLEVLKSTETFMDLEPPAMPIESTQEAQETDSSGETCVLDPPAGLPHIVDSLGQNQDVDTAITEPPTEADEEAHHIQMLQAACAPPSTCTGIADQTTPASVFVRNGEIGGDLSYLELEYYQDLDLPDDGIELQFLDMDLEQLYETVGEVEATLESEQQSLALETKIQQLSLLGSIHYFIFSRTGSVDDLRNAIENTEKALQEGASNINHPRYASCLKNLITMLIKKHNCTNLLADLDQAILRAEEMITLVHFHQPHQYKDLFKMKAIKCLQTGSAEELEELCIMKEMAAPSNDAQNRADQYIDKFKGTGDINDLQTAIRASGEALAEAQSSRGKVTILTKIANILHGSGNINGLDLADLNILIKASEEALATTHHDDPCWAVLSNRIDALLTTKFEQTGNISDLQTIIKLNQEYSKKIPKNLAITENLSWALSTRFELLGDLDDLQMAIKICEENRKSISNDQQHKHANLINLSGFLSERFGRIGDPQDLDAAVDAAEESVSITTTPSNKIDALHNLGGALNDRAKNNGNFDDLQKAIKVYEDLVAMTPSDHPKRPFILQNLSYGFALRFSKAHNLDDLQSAIQIGEQNLVALDTDYDHPLRANALFDLSNNLIARFHVTGAPDDFEKAIDLCKKATECVNSPPERRNMAAAFAFYRLAEKKRWAEASFMAEVAVELHPLLTPRQLKQRDQQHILKNNNGEASIAASIVLEAGKSAYKAVRLLELGRGVITGLQFGARTDLSELRVHHPEMAENFERLRDVLGSGTAAGGLVSLERINVRNDANLEFEKIIDQIRQLPNFKNFLLPPDANELMAAASQGPIALINAGLFRCDAFLIESHAIRSVRLPDLYERDIAKNVEFIKSIHPTHEPNVSSQIFRMLEWLWDTIVNPVLNELGFTAPPANGEWPHVWWIPTGQLSLLPLHAAGYHSRTSINVSLGETSPTNGTCPTPNTTIDRVISSYSSSIKALLYSRQNSRASEFQSGEALLVSMDKTPKNPDLKYAAEEVNALERLFPNQIKTVKLERPCKEAVLNHLNSCSIFHFAGHGELDPLDPSQSSLLVSDWQQNPLTVQNLIELNFREKSPVLAYLSACSTSNNSEDKLQDEAIHLVTACQLAGFKHVVGSLWEVSDMYSVAAAEEVYKTIVEDGTINADKVSLGVHRATRLLRDITSGRSGVPRLAGCEVQDDEELMGRGPRGVRPAGYIEKDETNNGLSNPLIWAPYVHVGA
ncbi:hypothetical protein TWF730_000825 [Orbilia blumenaviensis]|uniref:CHAT domain-containing protein n=1 Tax=Orbilia blumenaviensis TaxID=1796055 RepID=A0AAV9VQ05_9PEZI